MQVSAYYCSFGELGMFSEEGLWATQTSSTWSVHSVESEVPWNLKSQSGEVLLSVEFKSVETDDDLLSLAKDEVENEKLVISTTVEDKQK